MTALYLRVAGCTNSATILAFVSIGALSVAILQVYMTLQPSSSSATGVTTSDSDSASRAPGMEDSGRSGMRAIRASELSVCDGSDGAPLYVAVRDPRSSGITVFDMASGAGFYGPGGPYHVFAGKDATLGLARSSVDPAALEGSGIDSLSAHERDTHTQWYDKFTSKYPRVGFLVPDGVLDEDAYHAGSGSAGVNSAGMGSDKKNA